MAHGSGVQKVTEALADATGRSDDEVRVVLALGVVATGVAALLRLLRWLGDLGFDVLDRVAR